LSGSASYNGSGAVTFTVASNATSANTASAIVARDASGNFSAGTITAALSGNASSATASSTQAHSDTSTNIATTAWVRNILGARTTSGVTDWNDVSNTRPGTGYTLLLGTATNGMGGGNYYHPFNLEYSSNDGTGNVTQLAVAYGSPANEIYMRGRYAGSWSSWVRLLNSNNYNDYSPTLTGTGASGTWGINITGNSATTTKAVVQDTRAAERATSVYSSGTVEWEFTNQIPGVGAWGSLMTMKGWAEGYNVWQLIGPSGAGSPAGETWWLRSGNNGTWNAVRAILHSGNYNSYSPTLTGTGASGTWGINITGNAATATTATTSSQVTINYNNDSASTYQMLWGSGNSVYGTAGVYLNPSTDYVYGGSFNAGNWFRSTGNSGWYSMFVYITTKNFMPVTS